MDKVTLYGISETLYFWRVRWALVHKSITHEYKLLDHSPGTRHHNIYKPDEPSTMLYHKRKANFDSLDILDYIDKKWKVNPILPKDPAERERKRSWADFYDIKCQATIRRALVAPEEKKEEAFAKVQEVLKELDEELEERGQFFGGNIIDYTDMALGWLAFWLEVTEEAAGFKAMDADDFPNLASWMNKLLQDPCFSNNLPPRDETTEYYRKFRQDTLGSSSS